MAADATQAAESKTAERPLNIAIVHASDSGGGAERCVLTLHETLRELGHQSRLYVGRRHTGVEGVVEIERLRGVPGLQRLALTLERLLGWQHVYSPGFRRLVHALPADTDVVHINSLFGAEGYADVGALPALTRRFPSVITLHDAWLMTGHCACPIRCERWTERCRSCPELDAGPAIPRDGSWLNWSRKRSAVRRSLARFTVVSDWLRRFTMRSPMTGAKPVAVVHNSLDERVFKPGSQAAARAELGLPGDAFVVLLTGQDVLGSVKGTPDAAEALRRVARPHLRVLLAGRHATDAARMMPAPAVAVPYQRDAYGMVRCYRAADITVVPSYFETFGRSAAESLACGTPVVAYATGGLPEVVKSGAGGVLVATGDVGALAAAIAALMDHRPRLARMGRLGATWAHEHFSRVRVAQDYVTQYREAIAQRRGS